MKREQNSKMVVPFNTDRGGYLVVLQQVTINTVFKRF